MIRLLLVVWILFACGLSLTAQVDSLQQVRPDSLTAPTAPAWFQPVDSSRQEQSAPKRPVYQRAWTFLDTTIVPELYEEEDRLKLRIRIPWREDVIVPYFPRGFTQVPNPPPYSPEIAWQRSAILPGLGQMYNGDGWKVPMFWAGYGAAAWWINFNQSRYQRFGRAFLWAVDDDPSTTDAELAAQYDSEGLRSARNAYREARDNGILILLGWHGLQVIEAYVSAHLKDFDVEPVANLEYLRPVIDPNGIGICYRF